MTTGCRKVRVPNTPWGSATLERFSSAGELMAPPATTKCLATMRVADPDDGAPLGRTGTQTSAFTVAPVSSNACARVSTNRRAPRSSAAGTVVTSMDCLAFVGHPIPQEPRFQQPLTLRKMAAAGMPSLAAPRRSRSLFSFGGASQGPMLSRRSACRNQGAIESSVSSVRPKCRCQCCKVLEGVRNELVQLTVVEPPTHRPCRMLMALSAVFRAALS